MDSHRLHGFLFLLEVTCTLIKIWSVLFRMWNSIILSIDMFAKTCGFHSASLFPSVSLIPSLSLSLVFLPPSLLLSCTDLSLLFLLSLSLVFLSHSLSSSLRKALNPLPPSLPPSLSLSLSYLIFFDVGLLFWPQPLLGWGRMRCTCNNRTKSTNVAASFSS